MRYYKLILVGILFTTPLAAFFGKKVTIKNETESNLVGAFYHVSSSYALRVDEPFDLAAGTTVHANVPMAKPFKRRKLFVDANATRLTAKVDVQKSEEMPRVVPIKIGLGHAANISAVSTDNGIALRPTDEHAAQRARKELRTAVARQSKKYGTTAYVSQYEGSISSEEKAFIKKRRQVTTKAIRQFLGNKVNVAHIPRISMCASGGGMRATLAAMGVLKGLDRIGLLNGLEYMTGVSGGTWTLVNWIAEQTSIGEHIERTSTRFEKKPGHSTLIRQALGEHASLSAQKSLFGLGSGLADIVGICLSRLYLKPIDPFYRRLTLSKLSSYLHPAQHPFPICTAVTPRPKTNSSFHWLEFSPYDIRLATGNFAIPTWAFMRRFKGGISTDYMPEPHLGYSMALWGSAFSLSIEDMLTKSPLNFKAVLPPSVIKEISQSKMGRTKRFAAMIPNPVYQMPDASEELQHKQFLPVIDAAHHNNIPVTPLLHAGRHQDILILINATRFGLNDNLSLRTMKETRNMLKKSYPGVNFNIDKALGNPFSFFPSEKPGVPHVIHITLHKVKEYDPDYDPSTAKETKTTNARYTAAQINKLTGLTEHIIVANQLTLKKAVASAAAKREYSLSNLDWLSQNITSWFS